MLKRVLCLLVIATLFVMGFPVSGQDEPTITIDLTPYEQNPVLSHGEQSTWEQALWRSKVIFHDGLFHMLYHGHNWTDRDLAIGYATSTDGLNWTRYEGNPVFEPDPSLGPYVGLTGVMVEGDTWVMYVCSVPSIGTTCDVLYRATAPDPTATWSVDPEPVLEAGTTGDWDFPQIYPISYTKTDEGYVMYYADQNGRGVGMATSPDGITWTKYNDPTTTETKYQNSDPVMTKGAFPAWDSGRIDSACVRQRDGGWEMFYSAISAIGYATSSDGITWLPFPDNPALTLIGLEPSLDTVLVIDDVYYLYYTTLGSWNIAVATGTVTWE